MEEQTNKSPFLSISKGDTLVSVNYCVIQSNPVIRFIFKRKGERKLFSQEFMSTNCSTRAQWLQEADCLEPFALIGTSISDIEVRCPGINLVFDNGNSLFLNFKEYLFDNSNKSTGS